MRAIAYDTYKQFAKMYNIKLSKVIKGKRKLKKMNELASEIYAFESKNKEYLGNQMLYFE